MTSISLAMVYNPGRETLDQGRLWFIARYSNLFQMSGNTLNDKCTKGGNCRESDIREKLYHMLQSSPTPGDQVCEMWWG